MNSGRGTDERRDAPGHRSIRVPHLARVEGEAGLVVRFRGGELVEVRLEVVEPPRFFEALLIGRHCSEVPDITARICGICPAAYQLCGVRAIEDALGVEVDEQVALLRRVLMCAEWLDSHALHVHLLHAPDFLGLDGAVDLARRHPELLARGLQLKRLGHELLRALGGRGTHPVNVRVGGFHRLPEPGELDALARRLGPARAEAERTLRWVAGFEFPDATTPCAMVALRDVPRYPLVSGRLASSEGLDGLDPREFERRFEESQVRHSTALHCAVKGRGSYSVGPLARFALNRDALHPLARRAADRAGLVGAQRNPFRSIVVRSVEMLHVCAEAYDLLRSYRPPRRAWTDAAMRAGTGHAWVEAPRGLLYNRYTLDGQGRLTAARIVPPTSQNLAAIEADLRGLLARDAALDRKSLTLRCEHAVRNYDPCISCSTHWLRLELHHD